MAVCFRSVFQMTKGLVIDGSGMFDRFIDASGRQAKGAQHEAAEPQASFQRLRNDVIDPDRL